MKSLIVNWFLNLKLEVTLEEAQRRQLPVLDLSTHGLEECPNFMTRLIPAYTRSLRCLFLQMNHLTQIPRTNCHCLENLKALALDYNQLIDLPYDFRNLRNLTILNVSHNKFRNGHFFFVICQLKTLRILWANATGLEKIPPEIQNLASLRTLGLRKNKIRGLPKELFLLENLKWLTLSNNLIQNVPHGIGSLKRLVHLNLERNQILRLPTSIVELEALQYLYLQYNFLIVDADVRSLILQIPRLKKCFVSENLTTVEVQEIVRDDNLTPTGLSETDMPMDLEDENITSDMFIQGIYDDLGGARLQDALNNNGPRPNNPVNHRQRDEGRRSEPEGRSNDRRQDAEVSREDLFTVYRKSPQSRAEVSVAPMQFSDMSNSEEGTLIPQLPSEIPAANQEASHMEVESPPHVVHLEDPQIRSNVSVTSSTSSARMRRTEEWVMTHLLEEQLPRWQSLTSPSPSLRLGGRSSSNNVPAPPNNSPDIMVIGSQTNISGQVDSFIRQAAENVNPHPSDNQTPSTNLGGVFVMPHGKEPELIRIPSIRANLNCRRSVVHLPDLMTSSGSSHRLNVEHASRHTLGPNLARTRLSILDNDGETENATVTAVDNHITNLPANPVRAQPVPVLVSNTTTTYEIEADVPVLREPITFPSTTSFSSRLVVTAAEMESMYDPNEWENSAPSSAIDDQDIATRIAEFHSVPEVPEDEERFPPLNETDWGRLVGTVLIR